MGERVEVKAEVFADSEEAALAALSPDTPLPEYRCWQQLGILPALLQRVAALACLRTCCSVLCRDSIAALHVASGLSFVCGCRLADFEVHERGGDHQPLERLKHMQSPLYITGKPVPRWHSSCSWSSTILAAVSLTR